MDITLLNNGALSLEIPKGFRVLTAVDIQLMGRRPGPNEWSIRNEKKHMISEVTWKKIPFYAGGTPLERTLANTENYVARAIPSYKKVSNFDRTIGGEEAQGFRYTYNTSGTDMTAEYILLKHAKQYYSFSLMGPTDTFDENYQLFAGMLDSVLF